MSNDPIGERDRSDEGRGRTALVTGASSGIGMAMSRLLAAKGYDIVIVARRKQRLEDLRAELESQWAVRAHVIVADLSLDDSPHNIVHELENMRVDIDFLVNNAGYTDLGAYADLPWDVHQRRLRVLALSTLELTHRMLPGMVARGWGRIINVASIAGVFIATPRDVLYSASKALVHRFTEGIAAEYAGLGIHCTASLPGFTATEIFDGPAPELAAKMRSDPLISRLSMAPETIARQAYDAVTTGRRTVVHGWQHKLLGAVAAHSPTVVRRAIAQALSGMSA